MRVKSEKNHRQGVRFLAFTVVFVFTVTSVTWTTPVGAAPAEAVSASVLPIDSLAIPAEMGSITKEYGVRSAEYGGNEKPGTPYAVPRTVILVQDAHAVMDAQENIAKILKHLQKKYGVRLTALEGAKGRLEPVLLRSFPEPSAKRKILAGYEKRAELSGPEVAAVLQSEPSEFRGMEDWGLYERNYAAYLGAQANKDFLLNQWNTSKQTLDSERAKVYDPRLNEFEEIRENFLSERVSLLDLLIYLSKFQKLFKKDSGYQELPKLIATIGYEKSGKQEALVPMVRKIADEFKQKYLRDLGVKAEMNFYNRYQAFMTGQITAGQMLQYLVQTGSEHGKVVELTPALKKLLGHTELLSEIKGSGLSDELQSFLLEVESSLIKTPAQREMAEKYQKLLLLKELISLELTHEGLSKYQKEPDAYLGLMTDPAFERGLAPALEFYRVALARDQAFMTKINEMMTASNQETLAVVSGGFHTNGLERILKEKGVAYAVVTPKISSLEGSENYAKVMKGDVSFRADLKTTYFDALMRHASKALVGVLPIHDRVKTLKVWRDNVIRELAREGRIADAGKYLPYIDEILQNMPEAVNAVGPKRTKEELLGVIQNELERFKKDSLERVWKTFEFQLGIFTDGLKQLVAQKELSTKSVSALLDRASQAKPSLMNIPQFLDPNGFKGPPAAYQEEPMSSPIVPVTAGTATFPATTAPMKAAEIVPAVLPAASVRSESRLAKVVAIAMLLGALLIPPLFGSGVSWAMAAGAKVPPAIMAIKDKTARNFLAKGINKGTIINLAVRKEKDLMRAGKESTMTSVSSDLTRIIDEVYAALPESERIAMHNLAMYIIELESEFRSVIQRNNKGNPIILGVGLGQVEIATAEDIFRFLALKLNPDHPHYVIQQAEREAVAKRLGLRSGEELVRLIMMSRRVDRKMFRYALAHSITGDRQLDLLMVLIKMHQLLMGLETGGRHLAGGEKTFTDIYTNKRSAEFYVKLYRTVYTLLARLENASKNTEPFYKPMPSEAGPVEQGEVAIAEAAVVPAEVGGLFAFGFKTKLGIIIFLGLGVGAATASILFKVTQPKAPKGRQRRVSKQVSPKKQVPSGYVLKIDSKTGKTIAVRRSEVRQTSRTEASDALRRMKFEFSGEPVTTHAVLGKVFKVIPSDLDPKKFPGRLSQLATALFELEQNTLPSGSPRAIGISEWEARLMDPDQHIFLLVNNFSDENPYGDVVGSADGFLRADDKVANLAEILSLDDGIQGKGRLLMDVFVSQMFLLGARIARWTFATMKIKEGFYEPYVQSRQEAGIFGEMDKQPDFEYRVPLKEAARDVLDSKFDYLRELSGTDSKSRSEVRKALAEDSPAALRRAKFEIPKTVIAKPDLLGTVVDVKAMPPEVWKKLAKVLANMERERFLIGDPSYPERRMYEWLQGFGAPKRLIHVLISPQGEVVGVTDARRFTTTATLDLLVTREDKVWGKGHKHMDELLGLLHRYGIKYLRWSSTPKAVAFYEEKYIPSRRKAKIIGESVKYKNGYPDPKGRYGEKFSEEEYDPKKGLTSIAFEVLIIDNALDDKFRSLRKSWGKQRSEMRDEEEMPEIPPASLFEYQRRGEILNKQGQTFDEVLDAAQERRIVKELLQDPRSWRIHEQDEVRAAYASQLSRMDLEQLGDEARRLFTGGLVPLNALNLMEFTGEDFLEGFVGHLSEFGELTHYIGYARPTELVLLAINSRPEGEKQRMLLELDKFAIVLREIAMRWSLRAVQVPFRMPGEPEIRHSQFGDLFKVDPKKLDPEQTGQLAEAIFELYCQSFPSVRSEVEYQRGIAQWEARIQNPARDIYVRINSNDELTGVIDGAIMKEGEDRFAFIETLMSRKDEFAHKGYALMDAFISEAFRQGAKNVSLTYAHSAEGFHEKYFNTRHEAGVLGEPVKSADLYKVVLLSNPLDPQYDKYLRPSPKDEKLLDEGRSEVRETPGEESFEALLPEEEGGRETSIFTSKQPLKIGFEFPESAFIKKHPRLGKVFKVEPSDLDPEKFPGRLDQLAEALFELEFESFPLPRDISRWKKLLLESDRFSYVLVDSANAITGFATGLRSSGTGEAELDLIMTRDDGIQGKGVFLLDSFLSRMFARGEKWVQWTCLTKQAMKFYDQYIKSRLKEGIIGSAEIIPFESLEGVVIISKQPSWFLLQYKVSMRVDPLDPKFDVLRASLGGRSFWSVVRDAIAALWGRIFGPSTSFAPMGSPAETVSRTELPLVQKEATEKGAEGRSESRWEFPTHSVLGSIVDAKTFDRDQTATDLAALEQKSFPEIKASLAELVSQWKERLLRDDSHIFVLRSGSEITGAVVGSLVVDEENPEASEAQMQKIMSLQDGVRGKGILLQDAILSAMWRLGAKKVSWITQTGEIESFSNEYIGSRQDRRILSSLNRDPARDFVGTDGKRVESFSLASGEKARLFEVLLYADPFDSRFDDLRASLGTSRPEVPTVVVAPKEADQTAFADALAAELTSLRQRLLLQRDNAHDIANLLTVLHGGLTLFYLSKNEAMPDRVLKSYEVLEHVPQQNAPQGTEGAFNAYQNEVRRNDLDRITTLEQVQGINKEIGRKLAALQAALENLKEVLREEKIDDDEIWDSIAMIESLLFANPESLPIFSIDLMRELEAAWQSYRGLFQSSFGAADFNDQLETSAAPIKGNRIALKRIILNFLTNSRNVFDREPDRPFADRKAKLTLSERGSDYVVEYENSGKPIEMADPNNVFESGVTTKTDGIGHGLGLAICKRYVEAMGGTIAVRNRDETTEGRGVVFTITLPKVPMEVTPDFPDGGKIAGSVPVAPKSSDVGPIARSEARLVASPLVAVTGASAEEIAQMAQEANPDAVRAWFLKQGQGGIASEKVKFADQEAVLMAQLQEIKEVDALMGFISAELPQLLMKRFEQYGMTDVMAAEISAQTMVESVEGPVALEETGGVRRPGVGKVDVGKIQRATASIYDLINKMSGSAVPMIVNNGPDSAVVLQALKTIEVPRLIVLYDEHNPVGRGWNDASRIVMKYRFSERKPANALVGDVVKASEGEALMAFLTTELGVEQRGILSILAVFASQDNPELKKLVCAAAVLINRLYASASPMEQELMKVDPGMLITKLKEKGIDLLALSAKNGVLVMSMEALALEFSAQKDIEKAA